MPQPSKPAEAPVSANNCGLSKAGGLAAIGFAGLFLCLCLSDLGSKSFWFDEVDAVYFTGLGFREYWSYIATSPTNAPLYYLIEYAISTLGGASEFAFRLPSALFFALSLWLFCRSAAEFLGERKALVSMLLLGASPPSLYFAQEARSYSLFFLFAVLAIHFALRLANGERGRSAAGFAMAVLGGMSSHFFMALTALGLAAGVFIALGLKAAMGGTGRADKQRALGAMKAAAVWLAVAGAAVAAVYLPRFLALPEEVAAMRIPPVPELSLEQLWASVRHTFVYEYPLNASAETIWILGGVGLAAFGLGAALYKKKPFPWILFGLYCWILVSAIAFLSWRQSFYSMRYLIPALSPLFMLVGNGLVEASDWAAGYVASRTDRPGDEGPLQKIFLAVLAVCLLLPAASLVGAWRGHEKQDWRAAAEYVRKNARAGDTILLEGIAIPPAAYYLKIPVGELHREERGAPNISPIVPWSIDRTVDGVRILGTFDPEKMQEACGGGQTCWLIAQRLLPQLPLHRQARAWSRARMSVLKFFPGLFSDILVGQAKVRPQADPPGDW